MWCPPLLGKRCSLYMITPLTIQPGLLIVNVKSEHRWSRFGVCRICTSSQVGRDRLATAELAWFPPLLSGWLFAACARACFRSFSWLIWFMSSIFLRLSSSCFSEAALASASLLKSYCLIFFVSEKP